MADDLNEEISVGADVVSVNVEAFITSPTGQPMEKRWRSAAAERGWPDAIAETAVIDGVTTKGPVNQEQRSWEGSNQGCSRSRRTESGVGLSLKTNW